MPRRTHTYHAGNGWENWNFVATVGAYILGIGVFLAFANLAWTAFRGKKCSNDPWDGRTLEWSLPSPVPEYNFAQAPVIAARDAFFEDKHGSKRIGAENDGGDAGVHMPSQSWMPLLASAGSSSPASASSSSASGSGPSKVRAATCSRPPPAKVRPLRPRPPPTERLPLLTLNSDLHV
jgi:heme/copper-type cytochrome/quinol oxidase subunit 1